MPNTVPYLTSATVDRPSYGRMRMAAQFLATARHCVELLRCPVTYGLCKRADKALDTNVTNARPAFSLDCVLTGGANELAFAYATCYAFVHRHSRGAWLLMRHSGHNHGTAVPA